MSDIETIRQKVLLESQPLGSKSRFGLFSHPISTAVADDGPYKTKLHPRNQQGKPVTKERNFQTSPTKTGQVQSAYFGPLNGLATSPIKDTYIDPGRRLQMEQNQKFNKGRKPDVNFIPSSGPKTLSSSAYQYKEEKPKQLDAKRNRQQDGRVKLDNKNFYTNSPTKVVDSFFKPYPHIEDPYERAKKMQIQKQKKNKSMEAQSAFKPNSFIPQKLNSDSKIYGEDVQLKKKPSKQLKLNIMNHQSSWKTSSPNKHGLYGYFEPFPKYIENPPRQIKRRNSDMIQKQAFKNMNYTMQTSPSPSITLNSKNLRRIAQFALKH